MNKPKRLKLKEWARLESIKKLISEYAKRGGYEPLGEFILQAIRLCGVRWNYKKKPWYETIAVFSATQEINKPKKIPMLTANGEDITIPWDYPFRDWVWWLNLFASKYGWSEEQISKLDFDDAIALYQEIQVEDQMEKEWQYGLSELAYEYIPSTKKSKFRPLHRPSWMLVTKDNYKPKTPKKVKILASMMPVGNILLLDKEEDANATTKPS